AKHVINGDPFRHRFCVEEVEPGRHRLQQTKTQRRRKRRPPDMPDNDLRVRQQRDKMRDVALIVEDRRFQRRLDLGENSRRDRRGEMAEKQGFHLALPSQPTVKARLSAFSASHGKELEAALLPAGSLACKHIIYCAATYLRKT